MLLYIVKLYIEDILNFFGTYSRLDFEEFFLNFCLSVCLCLTIRCLAEDGLWHNFYTYYDIQHLTFLLSRRTPPARFILSRLIKYR